MVRMSGNRKGIISSPITKTLRKGMCPMCGLPLFLRSENFRRDGLSVALREGGTNLTISCSGQVALLYCAGNHLFPSEIRWENITITCGTCKSLAYPDRNTIVCGKCGILASAAVVESLSESVISWVVEDFGLRPDQDFSGEFVRSSTERRNFLTTVFSPVMRIPPIAPSAHSAPSAHFAPHIPPPPAMERRPIPKMEEPFPTPVREGPEKECEVLGLLAKGGFSRVYLARIPNGMYVAVKKPWGHRTEQEKGSYGRVNPYGIAVEKLSVEASFLKVAKGTKGVVDFLNFYYEGDTPCLVMRFVDGPNLRKYVTSRSGSRQGGGLELSEALDVYEQIIAVIRFIHNETNMVHRDITPNNVIMENGQIVMIDFGTISPHSEISEEVYTGIQAGGYHSPEQAQGASSKICDIYSLGSMLFFLLTGKDPPRPSLRNPTDKMMIHEFERVGVPEDLVSIMMKARALSPGARHSCIDELRNAIKAFRDPGWSFCGFCDTPMRVGSVTCDSCGATLCDICGKHSQKGETTCACGSRFCPVCRVSNSAEAFYCRFCGQSLRGEVVCENCNQQTSISAIFCRYCGFRMVSTT